MNERTKEAQDVLDRIVKNSDGKPVEWSDNPGTQAYQDKMLARPRVLRTNKVEA